MSPAASCSPEKCKFGDRDFSASRPNHPDIAVRSDVRVRPVRRVTSSMRSSGYGGITRLLGTEGLQWTEARGATGGQPSFLVAVAFVDCAQDCAHDRPILQPIAINTPPKIARKSGHESLNSRFVFQASVGFPSLMSRVRSRLPLQQIHTTCGVDPPLAAARTRLRTALRRNRARCGGGIERADRRP